MKKRIVINGDLFCTKPTGMHRFILQNLLELDHILNDRDPFLIEVAYPFYKSISFPAFKKIKIKPIFSFPRMYRSVFLPLYLTIGAKIYCGLANNAPIGKRNIICIHDLIPLKKIALFPENEYKKRMQKFRKIKEKSEIILTVSEYSKKDISKTLGILPEKICVLYNGWEHINKIQEDDSILSKFGITPKKYIYALGSIMPHKNFIWIRKVAEKNPDMHFVIAGELHELGRKQDIQENNITYCGYVTDEQNKSLMKNCLLFVQPSKEEGFGIPPLEALACGAKVAVSSIPCFKEIYEDCTAYFDPDNYDVNLYELIDVPVAEPAKLFEKCSWVQSARKLHSIFYMISNRRLGHKI